jgi:hypothetical protein
MHAPVQHSRGILVQSQGLRFKSVQIDFQA